MKVRKTVTMEKRIAEVLDANCVRHGDVTFHIENALTAYFKELRPAKKQAKKEVAASSDADQVIDYLNAKAGTSYTYSASSRKPIDVILKSFSVDDCKIVIDKKVADWDGTDNAMYLRPQTLFRPSKFEGYLNQPMRPSLARDQAAEEWASGSTGRVFDHEGF